MNGAGVEMGERGGRDAAGKTGKGGWEIDGAGGGGSRVALMSD